MILPPYHSIFRSFRAVRVGMNLWPPFLFSGIRVEQISGDFRYVRVGLRDGILNRNYVGTMFGGSLFAMADPFFMLMIMNSIGKEHYVWDKAARIEFVKPGREHVTVEFRLDDKQIADLREAASTGEKVLRDFDCEVRDKKGDVVARITRTIYVRLKPKYRPQT